MVAVAIYSVDPALRLRLEQLLRAEKGYTVASVTHDPVAVSRLLEQACVDTVVAHAPPREQLTDWRDRYPATTSGHPTQFHLQKFSPETIRLTASHSPRRRSSILRIEATSLSQRMRPMSAPAKSGHAALKSEFGF
jgi:hypothetical protein